MDMEKSNLLVAKFIKNLEHHPNGKELIQIITDIVSNDFIDMDSYVVSSIMMLTDDNPDILIDLCFLRFSILREQGFKMKSYQALFDAVAWSDNNIGVLSRIIEELISSNDLLYASYFIEMAKSTTQDDTLFSEEKSTISQSISRNLKVQPGF